MLGQKSEKTCRTNQSFYEKFDLHSIYTNLFNFVCKREGNVGVQPQQGLTSHLLMKKGKHSDTERQEARKLEKETTVGRIVHAVCRKSRNTQQGEKLNVTIRGNRNGTPFPSVNDTNAGETIADGKSIAPRGVEGVAKQRMNGQ